MDISPICNADGLPVVQFGKLVHRQRQIKGFTVSFEWCRDPDNRKRVESCIAIWSNSVNKAEAGAWVITRRGIMRFSDQHNRPTTYAFVEARAALPVLGLDTTDLEMRRLVDVVMDSIDDLVQMPLAPPAAKKALKRAAMWEVTRRNTDRQAIDRVEV
jgi:hypothetical protein